VSQTPGRVTCHWVDRRLAQCLAQGERKTVRCVVALTIAMSLAGGLAACAYEDQGEPQTTSAGPSQGPARTIPAKGPDVLAVEARNYAELDQRLARAAGSVLLADAGPADGPGVGFSKSATVVNAGAHTVTAACVGIPARPDYNFPSHGRRHRTQGIPSRLPRNPDAGPPAPEGVGRSQLAARRDPTGAWTGAVAGIKITAG